MSLASRFALVTSIGLAVVMALAGWMLLSKSEELVDASVDRSLRAAARAETERGRAEGEGFMERGNKGDALDGVGRFPATIRTGRLAGRSAHLYEVEGGASILARSRRSSRTTSAASSSWWGCWSQAPELPSRLGRHLAARPLRALVDDVQALAARSAPRPRPRGRGRWFSSVGRSLHGPGPARGARGRARARGAGARAGGRSRGQRCPPSAVHARARRLDRARRTARGLGDRRLVPRVPRGGGRTIVLRRDRGGVPGALVATARASCGRRSSARRLLHRSGARESGPPPGPQPGLAVTALCVAWTRGPGTQRSPARGTRSPRCAGPRRAVSRPSIPRASLGFDKGPFFERSLEGVRSSSSRATRCSWPRGSARAMQRWARTPPGLGRQAPRDRTLRRHRRRPGRRRGPPRPRRQRRLPRCDPRGRRATARPPEPRPPEPGPPLNPCRSRSSSASSRPSTTRRTACSLRPACGSARRSGS